MNKQLPAEMDSLTRVRFQDCDPFGHLNSARYMDYFITARQEQLAEHYDFHLYDYGRRTSQSWVIAASYIAYLAPAAVAEQVTIRTRLIEVTEQRMMLEVLMISADGGRLKAMSWIAFAYVSLITGRPAEHPSDIMAMFGALVVPVAIEDGFDRRVAELRAALRALRTQRVGLASQETHAA